MLYAEPRHNLNSLIAWLETKDPKECYNWADPGRCLMGQYCREHRLEVHHTNFVMVCGDEEIYGRIGYGKKWDFLEASKYIAIHGQTKFHELKANEWTFGQALERAMAQREKLKQQELVEV